jgi:hypothetical protein
LSIKGPSKGLVIILLFLLFSNAERAAYGQSIYRGESGFFLAIDLIESWHRQLTWEDGRGLGGEAGIRWRNLDLGLFLRRAGEKDIVGQIFTGVTAFGPAFGYTLRWPDREAGAAFSVQGILVRDDKTGRDWTPGGPYPYTAGPAITAHVIRARAVYFHEVRYGSGLMLSPKIGGFYYARFSRPSVNYFYPGGQREERISETPAQHAPGVVMGMPVTVEPFQGHRFTLEPVIEIHPRYFPMSTGINVRLAYNL